VRIINVQYRYKLRAFSGLFTLLVIYQLIALVLSLGGVEQYGTGSNNVNINISIFSTNLMLAVTLLWALVIGWLLPGKQYREGDFYFSGNRVSSNLSNILFLITACVVGGLTVMLSNFLLKVVMVLGFHQKWLYEDVAAFGSAEWLKGFAAMILYIILFASLGYGLSSLLKLRNGIRTFVVLFVICLVVGLSLFDKFQLFIWFGHVFFEEASFFIFVWKVLLTTVIAFGLSIVFTNRQEVRR